MLVSKPSRNVDLLSAFAAWTRGTWVLVTVRETVGGYATVNSRCLQRKSNIFDASPVYLYCCHNPTTLKKSAFKPKMGHESTTGIHLIDE